MYLIRPLSELYKAQGRGQPVPSTFKTRGISGQMVKNTLL